jgi:hypothetical protein
MFSLTSTLGLRREIQGEKAFKKSSNQTTEKAFLKVLKTNFVLRNGLVSFLCSAIKLH